MVDSDDSSVEMDRQEDQSTLQVQGEPAPRPWWTGWIHYTGTTLLVGATFVVIGWTAMEITAQRTDDHTTAAASDDAPVLLADAHLRAQQQRLRLALDIHALVDRNYPASLRALISRGLLVSSDLYYASGRPRFEYIIERDQFRLEPLPARSADRDGSDTRQ